MRILPVRPGDESAVAAALAAALEGTGPPVAPFDGASSSDLHGHLAHAMDDAPPDLALAVTTSGSTGAPRTVALSRGSLRASASATSARLGGPGRWLLALPLHHIAGLQVLTRSVLAGTEPVSLDMAQSFTAARFAAATARLQGSRRYTSLVPTQLHRLLASEAGRDALTTFDAVLVGGAATSPTLAREALDAGVHLVRTYGMTETAGGCVYDGHPLDGVTTRLDDDGRIHLAGPVLAAGYLGEPELTARTFVETDGQRWLRTDDLGSVDDDGTLHVLGRVDDVITTGGVKVAPARVEAALTELAGIAQACVVGVPDPEWGTVVVAVVTIPAGAETPALEAVREHVAHTLGVRAAPRRLLVVPEIPSRGPGKPDRRAVARLAAAASTDGAHD